MDKAGVKLYFERIGLEMPEKIVPDAELLKKLTFHNIISIPYENTQFLEKKIIPCEDDALFQRIVVEGKGGICHDISSLFGRFLSELGYEVVPFGTVSFLERLKSHVHRTLIVTDCEGTQWLTEIGYATFTANKAPILFEPGREHEYAGEKFRLEKRDGAICLIGPSDEASYTLVHRDIPQEVGTEIKRLTLEGSDPAGAVKRNLAIGTPGGRRTLFGNVYRECFGDRLLSYECTPDTLPWAYSQFGLEYDAKAESEA